MTIRGLLAAACLLIRSVVVLCGILRFWSTPLMGRSQYVYDSNRAHCKSCRLRSMGMCWWVCVGSGSFWPLTTPPPPLACLTRVGGEDAVIRL